MCDYWLGGFDTRFQAADRVEIYHMLGLAKVVTTLLCHIAHHTIINVLCTILLLVLDCESR